MKILIIGMGVSGQAARRFLKLRGEDILCVDAKPCPEDGILDDKTQFIPFDFDLVVPSPGIALDHPLLLQAKLNAIEIIGEAELAFRFLKQSCIGITGTNGKTTTTMLVTHILNSAGIAAKAFGNIGVPLTDARDELVVAEISSNQLETMQTRIFDAAVILNITPDHLDRHKSFEEYGRVKCSIRNFLKKNRPLFVADQVVDQFGLEQTSSVIRLSRIAEIYLQLSKNIEYFSVCGYEDTLAAFALCERFGVDIDTFNEALKSFNKAPHRLEFVDEIEGVRFYNDSKGTNVEAVVFALSQISEPTILLAGGVDKGASYSTWIKPFSNKVKKVLVFGQAAKKIEEELNHKFQIEIVSSLEDALEKAFESAKRGEVIMLSPGCSSFDQFKNYEERGETFKRLVRKLRVRVGI